MSTSSKNYKWKAKDGLMLTEQEELMLVEHQNKARAISLKTKLKKYLKEVEFLKKEIKRCSQPRYRLHKILKNLNYKRVKVPED